MTAHMLTKTRSILTRRNPDDWEDRRYWQVDEESGVIRRAVDIDIQTFQDLGEPDTITVTIEPGDTMNATVHAPTAKASSES